MNECKILEKGNLEHQKVVQQKGRESVTSYNHPEVSQVYILFRFTDSAAVISLVIRG